jgi:ribosomal protein S18 acetylase RimI-like enzyme
MALEVIPVSSRSEKREFLNLPFRVYEGDPHWVCPPLGEQKHILFDHNHPFWQHGCIAPFIARKDGRTVGRIAAVEERAHNEFHGEKVGFFGFFEVLGAKEEPDAAEEVTRSLFKEVERWIAEKGFNAMRGPASPSSNYDWGCLLEGHNTPPIFLMPYNDPAYAAIYESQSLRKVMDVVSMYFDARELPEKVHRACKIAEKKGYTVRNLDFKRFWQDVDKIMEIYNDAWEKNWGFIPMGREEFIEQAKQLKMVVIPSLVKFVEHKGEAVGFALSMPDYNVAFRTMRGRLFPFGFLKILSIKRKPARAGIARVITLGVKKAHRHRGVDALLCAHSVQAGHDLGIWKADFGWVLETNTEAIQLFEHLGGRIYRRYRIYEKAIDR